MNDTPRLHRSITITRRQVGEDEVFYVVKDPRTRTFLRMGEVEVAVLRLLNGKRTLPDVARALAQAHDFRVDVSVIESFVRSMTHKGFIETRTFDPAAFRAEWRRQEMYRKRSLGKLLGSFATIKVKLINPERLFSSLVEPLGFLWTRSFFIWSMALLVIGSGMGIAYHQDILLATGDFFRTMTASKGAFATHAAIFYIVFFLVVAIHETAHGITCTRFGGKVPELGFILFYLQIPGFYCDVSDAYNFQSRSHRLWTTVAGGYTGLLLATIGLFLWWATAAGQVLNDAGIVLMVVGGPPLLAINWNPLIRYDGYYILMDLLEAPNLMRNSYKYLGYLFKSKILRAPVEPWQVAPRLRKIYVLYGIASLMFLAPLILFIPIIIYYVFTRMLGPELGLLIALVLGYRILQPMVKKSAMTLRYAWLSHRPALVAALGNSSGRVRIGLIGGAALLVGLFALFGPRYAVRAEALGVLEPWERIEVRAESPGFVTLANTGALPMEGESVHRGDLLVRLVDPDLTAQRRTAAKDLESLKMSLKVLGARREPAAAAVRRASVKALAGRVAVLKRQAELLSISSPIDGVVLTPRLDQRAGTYLQRGDIWCVVGATDRLRVRLDLTDAQLGVIGDDSRAELKALHVPSRTFHGRVTRLPAGRPPEPLPAFRMAGVQASWPEAPPPDDEKNLKGSLQVEVAIDNSGGLLLPGMRVKVRVFGERLTVAGHFLRWVHRLFKGKVWW
ncbi:MAG: efflux RND transporter periplasmic adaptor subunit [Acidobacteriota bacterium]